MTEMHNNIPAPDYMKLFGKFYLLIVLPFVVLPFLILPFVILPFVLEPSEPLPYNHNQNH